MRYEKPCLKEKWGHAFLMDDKYEHVAIDGLEMTAKNIWEYDGDREELLEKLVDYFYKEGFKPFIEVDAKSIEKDFLKLIDVDPKSTIDKGGSIKNSSRIGLDICREFCKKSFYSTRVNGTASILDVYKSKDLLRRVLKNRMGWYTTTEKLVLEDGTVLEGEHPYLFDISHKMVVQGCHSAMVSANVSNFRPIVAKLLMEKFGKKNGLVLDLSAGWGARLMAAMSLGMDYYGIDPMTASEVNGLAFHLTSSQKILSKLSTMKDNYSASVFNGVSEDKKSYASMPRKADYCIVCPPYFKLEEYQCDGNSTDVYADYSDWLEKYWRQTVKNARDNLDSRAKFTLIMVEKWGKHRLLQDMSSIVEQEGFKKVDEMQYKTTRSHLTDKRESKQTSKATEKVWTFEKMV